MMSGDLSVLEVATNWTICIERARFFSLDPYFLSAPLSHQRNSEKYYFVCFLFCKTLSFPSLLFRKN